MIALQSLLWAVDAPDTCLLFTFTSTSNQLACIMAKSLNDGIKHLASLISLDPQDLSGHSLRRGGIPAELIKLQGDWRSDAYMLYLSLPLADRLVLSNIISEHVQAL